MNFHLERQATDGEMVRFHVLNNRGAICGVINLANAAEADALVRHWAGSSQAAQPRPNVMAKAMLKAARRGG
jgi:hypothetical protein